MFPEAADITRTNANSSQKRKVKLVSETIIHAINFSDDLGLDYLCSVFKSADASLKVKVQMWDLVNHSKFMSVTKNFY